MELTEANSTSLIAIFRCAGRNFYYTKGIFVVCSNGRGIQVIINNNAKHPYTMIRTYDLPRSSRAKEGGFSYPSRGYMTLAAADALSTSRPMTLGAM